MGVVYLAERADQQYEQLVAIKLVRQRLLDPDVKKRLVSERQILANLDHPNIGRLFDGGTLGDGTPYLVSVAARRTTTPERLSRCLRGDVDDIIRAALRKEPERRYRSVNEFAEDIRRHLASHPVIARPDTWHYRTSRFLRRHRAGTAMSAGLVLLLVAFAATLTVQNQRIVEERDTAMEISTFLQDIFMEPDPGNARGASITAWEILGKGAARITTELDERPSIQATLMSTIGRVYFNLGEYGEAIGMLEKALAIRRKISGDAGPAVAMNKNRLGEALTRTAEYERAKDLLIDALEEHRRLHGERSPQVADSRVNLAELYQATGNAESAERNARMAVDIYSGSAGSFAAELAEAKSLLSRILQWQNQLIEADKLLREAIATVQSELGPDHPLLAYYLQNLAVLTQSRGDLDAAAVLFDEAILTTRTILGEEHSLLGGSLVMQGRLFHQREQYDKAETAFRETLHVHRNARGENHPFVGYDLVSLGMLLHDRNELVEAERLLREALHIYEASLDPEHQYIASALTELAAVLTRAGHPEDAEEIIDRAIAIRRRGYHSEHPLLAGTLAVAGYNRATLQRYREAEALLVDNYAVLRKQNGDRHRRTLQARRWLAALYEAWGRPEQAERYVSGTPN